MFIQSAVQRLCCLALVAQLTACTALAPGTVQVARDLVQQPLAELDQVAFFPDDTSLCGPSSLAALLLHAGVSVPIAQLTADVYVPGRAGALQLEMRTAAARHGTVPFRGPSDIAGLRTALQQGFPVLVLMNLGLDFAPSWHYAVVVGLSVKGTEVDVVLRSGMQRRQVLSLELFERLWARSRQWSLVLGDAARMPPAVTADEALHAILLYDRMAQAAQTLAVLQLARQRFPGDSLIAFAWASELQKAGRLGEAEQAWATLAESERNPSAAANLAYLLNAGGKTEEAADWACKALSYASAPGVTLATRDRVGAIVQSVLAASNRHCHA